MNLGIRQIWLSLYTRDNFVYPSKIKYTKNKTMTIITDADRMLILVNSNRIFIVKKQNKQRTCIRLDNNTMKQLAMN